MNRENLFLILTDLARAIQGLATYPENHPKIQLLLSSLHGSIQDETRRLKKLNMGFFADHIVVDEHTFVGLNSTLCRLLERVREKRIEKVRFSEGITFGELKRFVAYLGGGEQSLSDRKWESIACGKIEGAGSADGLPMGLSPPPPSLFPAGTLEKLGGILFSLASEGKTSGVREGQEIVSSIIDGLRNDCPIMDRLIHLREYDDYTVTHSLNVCILVIAQAARLGLSEANVRDAGLAALLHDVGKETIPSSILNKPGRLTGEEFDRVRKHPLEGAKLLRKIDCGSGIPSIVAFEHHVRYDGTGYPKAVSAETLHVVSYMTQIADVYDALRSSRPYKPAMDLDRTFSVMKQGRGTEFEPRVFDNFLEVVSPLLPAGAAGFSSP